MALNRPGLWALYCAALIALAGASFVDATPETSVTPEAPDIARYLPPDGSRYLAEELRLHAPGNQSLGGTLTLPARGATRNGRALRYPVVILIGGDGPHDRDGVALAGDTMSPAARPFFDLADTLTRRGLAVLRLDDRGVGASTGSTDSVTTLDRVGDMRAAIGALRRRADVNPRAIALLGTGTGAKVASWVAAADSTVRAIVLMAAPADADRELAGRTPALMLQAPPAPTRASPRLPVTLRGQVADWLCMRLGGATVAPVMVHRRYRRRL